jgi:hypothetical protein
MPGAGDGVTTEIDELVAIRVGRSKKTAGTDVVLGNIGPREAIMEPETLGEPLDPVG